MQNKTEEGELEDTVVKQCHNCEEEYTVPESEVVCPICGMSTLEEV